MARSADAVIIGGGIQGISLAYRLARLGLSNIVVLEMNTLGSGSSGRSAAIIGLAFQSEACLPLARWSLDAIRRFEEEMGAEPGYEPTGCLLLGGAGHSAELRERQGLLHRLGVESHLVDRQAIAELTPGLYLDDVDVALYNPHEGCIDPHSLMMAYAHQARRLGVDFREQVRATGLQVRGQRVIGVETTAGLFETPCVVNAAGFRAREVGRWAGMDLPITNLKRHIFVTGPMAAYSRPIPFTYDAEVAWYMRREGPGLLIGMGAIESDEEDPQVDWTFLESVVDYSLYRAPALAQAGIQSGWAGLRPMTPDEDPILGPAPNLHGFHNDCGWGGHGIMHAPAAGLALAEWIVEGEPSTVDIRRFCGERFAGKPGL